MKKTIVILLFIVVGSLKAQDFKFGKVSKEELQEEIYAKDSSAPAAYLYKKRTSYYRYSKGVGLDLITEVHKRIKVYNTDGFNFASETINLYDGNGDEEKVSAIKGYTYTLENGEVVKTKLDKDGIFKSKQSENRNQVKFTMPNVKVGSVVEFQYKIISPFLQNIDEFVFQEAIPTKKLEARMKIFEYFKFNQRHKGFIPIKPQTRRYRDSNLDLEVTETAFELTDVPAIKEEKFVSSLRNFRSGVKFEIVSLEVPGGTHKVYAKTWDDVVRTIYQSSSFGTEIGKANYFKEELDDILKGVTDQKEKTQKILAFVKQKVKWNSFRGVGTSQGVKKAYKEGIGNSADINLMLIAMLKHAKITSHPVLVSTRDNGIPLFPTLEGYNYVVAAAKIDGKYYLLDATNMYSTLDVLPTRVLNWYGRMISEGGNSETMDLMPKKKSADVVMLNVTLNEDGSMDAKCRQQYTNNNAFLYRNAYNQGTEDSFLEELEKEQGDIEISDFELKNNMELDKPIVQNYSFFKEDAFESIAGKLYFSPMFHLCTTENPFKSEKREYPVDYGFPWEDRYLITINIPEGYKIESLPEPISMSLPDSMGTFKYVISSAGNTINLRASISSNSAIIPPQYYGGLKEFYRLLVEKESEKVVLSKI